MYPLSTMTSSLLRKPSAWMPMVGSVAALGLILAYVATVGVSAAPSPDEGAPARIFQFVMVGVAAAIAYFAVRWLPVAPKAATAVLALQVALAALPIITILLLER